ncbi:MAG: hypothetical protein LC122_01550 [Chitinophagales bacterium]|nr:hypothetical protein [Chitinophagales bacterium]
MSEFVLSYLIPSIIGVIIFGGWVVRDAKKYGVQAVTPITGRIVLLVGLIASDLIIFFLGVENFLISLLGIWMTAFIELFIDWLFLTITGVVIWKTTFDKSFKSFMLFTLGWAILFIIGFIAFNNLDSVIPNIP